MVDEPLALGIATSCDETGVGVVRGRTLLADADAVASSVEEHARFGGVVPEVASRAHPEATVPTIQRNESDDGRRPVTMTVAVMWEARAVSGRAEELLRWARSRTLPAVPLRREVFRAPGDRVLVITWWPADHPAELPELPDPADDLVARPVHRWRFESVECVEADSGAPGPADRSRSFDGG